MSAVHRGNPVDAPNAQLSRTEVLRLLDARGEELREELACRHDAEPEILFFIAREGAPTARRAVAANPSTPATANRLLADDRDSDVRSELARKIARLLPDLSREVSEKVRALTFETLQCLADDQLPRVRQILAQEIKTLDSVPPHIIAQLARDVEIVSAPILEYSPLLSDSDLIDIITTAQARHAMVAIAKRRALSESVCEAIANVMDIPAVSALLENQSAQIRQKTLEKIIGHAERIRDLHAPLVARSDLSQRAIRRLAGFVGAALVERLVVLHKLDEETRLHLRRNMQDRVDEDGGGSPAEVIAARQRAGTLDDGFVASAAQDGHRDLVAEALARLAEAPVDVVLRIFDSRSAKPVTALVRRAGLSMRVAFKIQTFLLRLPASELLPARDGIRFPLTDDEMLWHLSYFGLDASSPPSAGTAADRSR